MSAKDEPQAKKAAAKKKPDAKKKRPAKKKTAPKRVPADQLPRRSLADAIAIARTLKEVHAGGPATWDQLCDNLEIGKQTNPTKYLFWAAKAYGVIKDAEESKAYNLAEVGRKIVSPTYEGESREGIRKAILTPTVLSQFYTDYDGQLVPERRFLTNIVSQKYSIPQERADEAVSIIIDNAELAGILTDTGDGKRELQLDAEPTEPGAPDARSDAPSEDGGGSEAITMSGAEAPATNSDWDKTCFVITPIGSDSSDERRHANMMLKHLIQPACAEFDLTVVRADGIAKQGLITRQIFEHLARSRICVTDMSFNNPNVFYELGVRHMFQLPNVQLIRKGDRIPFDVAQGRTIIIDTSDQYTIIDRINAAKAELVEHLRHFIDHDGPDDDNPIRTYLPGVSVKIPAEA